MEKKITYVTGNLAKISCARKILEPLGYIVDNIKMETPEIQADDVTEVAKFSAKWACDKLGKAVVKNDSGLFVKALKGFPGVYTHYVDDAIGNQGLLKLMEGIEDREAYFKEAIAYCEPGKEPIVFEGYTRGKIALKADGPYGMTWDKVFIPEGEDKTLGFFPDAERWNFWSLDCYTDLAKHLEENN